MKGTLADWCSGISLFLFITQICDVICHGGMLEPPMRSIAWRYGFDTPVNYDWMSLYCGGLHTFQQNGGKCGLCGDGYQGPYENDRGGSYDTGIIVRHYPIGLGEIEVKVELTAHHKGYFRFKLCPNNENTLTSECLDRYPLQIREGRTQGDPYRYYPAENPKLYELHIVLPPEVTCDRCVLQWTYTAGNSAGNGPDGRSCLGCGIQETFVNCADISIGGTRDHIPVAKGNRNASRAQPEIILPQRTDIVDIIRSAPPERSLDEFFRDIRQPEVPRRQTERIQRPPVAPFDPWGIERNAGFQSPNVPPPDFVHPSPDFVNPSSDPWGSSPGADPFDPSLRRSPIDNRFVDRGQGQFQPDGTLSGHSLDFSGINNPSLRAALNNHFQHNPLAPRENSPLPRSPVSRRGFRDPLGAPLSTHGSRGSTMDHVTNRQRTSNDRIITGQGPFSSLLGSLEPILNAISRRQQMEADSNRFQNGGLVQSSVLTNNHQKGTFHTTGTDVFGNPTREMFPTGSSRTHQQRTPSHSGFAHTMPSGGHAQPRRAQHTMHSGSSRFASNGMMSPSRSQFRTQERVIGLSGPAHVVSSIRTHQRPLPRRIVVHNMDVAQHLLRRYPQLKGRVFLSSHAHASNQYANTAHKYRQRNRW